MARSHEDKLATLMRIGATGCFSVGKETQDADGAGRDRRGWLGCHAGEPSGDRRESRHEKHIARESEARLAEFQPNRTS